MLTVVLDDPRFAAAEIGFAAMGENIGDAHPGRLFDFRVGVNERNAEPRGQPAADGGFAYAHHADQHDRAAAECGEHRRARVRLAL